MTGQVYSDSAASAVSGQLPTCVQTKRKAECLDRAVDDMEWEDRHTVKRQIHNVYTVLEPSLTAVIVRRESFDPNSLVFYHETTSSKMYTGRLVIGGHGRYQQQADEDEDMEDARDEGGLPACNACADEFDASQMIKLECGHKYCHGCLPQWLSGTTTGLAVCYGQPAEFLKAIKFLNDEQLMRIKIRKEESEGTIRVYCINEQCKKLVGHHQDYPKNQKCTRCNKLTCLTCFQVGHGGTCVQAANASLNVLMQQKSWKQCPKCRQAVSRSEGCKFVT